MRSTCFFVHLDGRLVAIDSNDLADELVMANFYLRHSLAKCLPALRWRMEPYQLVHGNANHVLGNDDWPARMLLAIVGGMRRRGVWLRRTRRPSRSCLQGRRQ